MITIRHFFLLYIYIYDRQFGVLYITGHQYESNNMLVFKLLEKDKSNIFNQKKFKDFRWFTFFHPYFNLV